jgi:Uri superfamily endonuclease
MKIPSETFPESRLPPKYFRNPVPAKASIPFKVEIIGTEGMGGTYLLRIYLQKDTRPAFGRFQRGNLFTIPKGFYIYIGSALNPRGATSLAPRLLRHATRSAGRPPHPIREILLKELHEIGLGSKNLKPPNTKKLFWNIDHLLDLEDAELVGVLVIRNPIRLEAEIGYWLAADPSTEVIMRGLGANDVPGGTHILRVIGDESWWEGLSGQITTLLAARD